MSDLTLFVVAFPRFWSRGIAIVLAHSKDEARAMVAEKVKQRFGTDVAEMCSVEEYISDEPMVEVICEGDH